MSIIHALLRWILDVCAPGTGKRRQGRRPAVPTPDALPTHEATRPLAAHLPTHRSPYGLPVPLNGESTVMVCPYVLTAERAHREHMRERARQARRRAALVLAADFGVDLDCHVIGAEGVVA